MKSSKKMIQSVRCTNPWIKESLQAQSTNILTSCCLPRMQLICGCICASFSIAPIAKKISDAEARATTISKISCSLGGTHIRSLYQDLLPALYRTSLLGGCLGPSGWTRVCVWQSRTLLYLHENCITILEQEQHRNSSEVVPKMVQ